MLAARASLQCAMNGREMTRGSTSGGPEIRQTDCTAITWGIILCIIVKDVVCTRGAVSYIGDRVYSIA